MNEMHEPIEGLCDLKEPQKNDPARFFIGEVSRFAGCHPRTVLNYEKKGLVTPLRDMAGRRRFTMEQAVSIRKFYNHRQPAL